MGGGGNMFKYLLIYVAKADLSIQITVPTYCFCCLGRPCIDIFGLLKDWNFNAATTLNYVYLNFTGF